MECKGKKYNCVVQIRHIGIYPEWNVKCLEKRGRCFPTGIGIYPEWNVKL